MILAFSALRGQPHVTIFTFIDLARPLSTQIKPYLEQRPVRRRVPCSSSDILSPTERRKFRFPKLGVFCCGENAGKFLNPLPGRYYLFDRYPIRKYTGDPMVTGDSRSLCANTFNLSQPTLE